MIWALAWEMSDSWQSNEDGDDVLTISSNVVVVAVKVLVPLRTKKTPRRGYISTLDQHTHPALQWIKYLLLLTLI